MVKAIVVVILLLFVGMGGWQWGVVHDGNCTMIIGQLSKELIILISYPIWPNCSFALKVLLRCVGYSYHIKRLCISNTERV